VIYVDTSVFLRHLLQPMTSQDVSSAALATALLDDAAHGRAMLTSSEATIAEVVFILSHRNHYGFPRPRVVSAITDLLNISGFRMPTKGICLRALEIWAVEAKLSFPDALGAAFSELDGHELATFDQALAKVDGFSLQAWRS
jgi:predicted nucleic acid-binding protein